MDLAQVIELPVRSVTRVATDWGRVDDWGRDESLFAALTAFSELRWDVSTGGADHVPARRGALIVVNAQRWAFTHVFAAFAISRAVDRPVRFVGRPDDSPIGALAQRLGGLIDHPDEVTGALRAGELVLVAADPAGRPREVGPIDATLVGAALAVGAPVLPAATTSSPFNRHARVEIGPPTKVRRRRRGPLAEVELADQLRDAVALLLEEMGDISTGTPLDWLPMSGLGGS